MKKNNQKNALRNCPICGKSNAGVVRHAYSTGEWDVKLCAECGFVYIENPPEYKELEVDYAWEKVHKDEEKRRSKNIFHWFTDKHKKLRYKTIKIDRLTKLVNRHFKPGNILDIGCGGGKILNSLAPGFVPYGIEVSRHLAERAKAHVGPKGGDVIQKNAIDGLESFKKNFFSGIIMSAFLEHEFNPRLLLKNALRVLAPGGSVIIKVPNYASINRRVRGARWCGFKFPAHVNYWTPESLVKILTETGFDVVSFTFFDRLPTNDNMWIVVKKPE